MTPSLAKPRRTQAKPRHQDWGRDGGEAEGAVAERWPSEVGADRV